MSAWNELIGRLTRRLEVDEELRLDVARELRCHLEDSAAEFRTAGQNDEQATASAIKALGDEKELAEQLWQANRRRIRLRGVLRWTARATLVPLAVAVVLVFFVSSISIVMIYQRLGEVGSGKVLGWPLAGLGQLVCDPYAGIHLTEEQRFLLDGDPNAKTEWERAKSISDRWPDNPVYYAHYVTNLLSQQKPIQNKPGETPRVDEEKLAQALAALRHGEQVDPNNAFYNLEIASLLVQASTILKDDPSTTYDTLDRDGKIIPVAVAKIEIVDAKRFDQGLEEFRRAMTKPLLTSRNIEMLRLRLDMLPAPFRLIQYLDRISMLYSTLLPNLRGYRDMSKVLLVYARQLAAKGQADQALQVPQDVKCLAVKLGTQGDTIVELLVAQSLRYQALGYQEILCKALGRPQAAQAARRQRMEDYEFFNHLRSGRIERENGFAHMGVLETLVTPGLPGYKVDMKPLRIAEQFVALQVGLLGLLVGLVGVSAFLGLTVVWNLIFLCKADRPVLLFVGWRRLGRICLLAVVAPLAVYAAYTFLAAAWSGDTGLVWVHWGRLTVELTFVVCIVLALLIRLACSTVRQRGLELGLAVPPPLTWRDRPVMLGLTVLVALAGGVYLVGWWAGFFRDGFGHDMGVRLLFVVGGMLVLWGLRELLAGLRQDRAYRHFQRSLRRSLIPILAAAVIVVGIGLGGLLATGEGFAVSRMGKGMPLPNEIKNSDYRLLQERFVEQEKTLPGQVSRPGPG